MIAEPSSSVSLVGGPYQWLDIYGRSQVGTYRVGYHRRVDMSPTRTHSQLESSQGLSNLLCERRCQSKYSIAQSAMQRRTGLCV